MIIYQAVNKFNGNSYIGATSRASFTYSDTHIDKLERDSLLNELIAKRDDNLSSRKRRSVICINDNNEYKSLKLCATAYDISVSRVMQLCQSGGSTKDGLRFKYNEQKIWKIRSS